MLVWYVDPYSDNNTITPPGLGSPSGGSHLQAIVASNGQTVTNRRGAFDREPSVWSGPAKVTFQGGVPVTLPSRPGVATFDDTNPTELLEPPPTR